MKKVHVVIPAYRAAATLPSVLERIPAEVHEEIDRILIVDFANKKFETGLSRHEAILQAAALRLRPILMPPFATVLGVLPLLLAFGAGANSRFAIGLMITAGMTVGTIFTLFVLPTFYLVLCKDRSPDHEEKALEQHRLNSPA